MIGNESYRQIKNARKRTKTHSVVFKTHDCANYQQVRKEEDMAEELVKTCENCEWEYESFEGEHCRHCIHNAEEHFEPKMILVMEQEIRNKAIDEYMTALCDKCLDMKNECYQLECPFCDDGCDIVNIAEKMKGGV